MSEYLEVHIYDLVTVSNDAANLSDDLRVGSVRHEISASNDGGKWIVTYGLSLDALIAAPQSVG